jgi:hypothetical protein
MCVILYKPANSPMFKWEYLYNSMNNNADGAGVMFPLDGKVIIHKGFMNYRQLKRWLRSFKGRVDLFKTPLVFHARLATHGKTKPENTHPFPLSSKRPDVQQIEAACDIGFAHNGIISQMPKDDIFSDSQLLVLDYLSGLTWEQLGKPHIKALMIQLFGTYNRMIFMHSSGEVIMCGDFEYKVEDGLWCSNGSYRTCYYHRGCGRQYSGGAHGWYDNDDFDGYGSNVYGSADYSTVQRQIVHNTKNARDPSFWKEVFSRRDKVVSACFGGDNASFYRYISSFQRDTGHNGCEACKATAKDIVFAYEYNHRKLCWECVTLDILTDFEKLDLTNPEVVAMVKEGLEEAK